MTDLSIVVYDVTPDVAANCLGRAERQTARAIELVNVVKADGDTPGKLRNAAIRRAHGHFVIFLRGNEPADSSFLEHAMRTLERDRTLSFVAAWHDGFPSLSDRPARPLAIAELLARPWFAFTPTLFVRELADRLSGFDEALAGLEDFEFWLRALRDGARGVAIEEPIFDAEPWGNSLRFDDPRAEAEARRVFERHRAIFLQYWEEALLGKERAVREVTNQRVGFERAKSELEAEEKRLSELAERC